MSLTSVFWNRKTTLLKYILHENHGRRIAVVQNEFGEEIGLERAVTMGKGPQLVDVDEDGEKPSAIQEWLELPNGCVCCTAKENLVLALENLVTQRRNKFDYIFVETTGMADPGPLATVLWVDEELGSRIYLDAIVTLVDAKRVLHHIRGSTEDIPKDVPFQPRKLESMRQIALSDVVLINKTDLIENEEKRKEIETELKKINGLAKFFFTHRSRIDLSQIMEIKSFDGNKLSHEFSDIHTHEHQHEENSNENSGAKPHSDGVITVVLKSNLDVVDVDTVSRWFADLLWEKKIPIFRIKGELSVAGDERRHIVQGVYDNFEVLPTEWKWGDFLPTPTMDTKGGSKSDSTHTTRHCVLVLIGQSLDQQTLQESFIQTCISK